MAGEETVRFVEIDWRGRPIRLEYQWVGERESRFPTVVFLHEGLGSVSMWKDFPERFCREHGFAGLVFSRYGYGRSTPRPAEERWPVGFMHAQAREVLPAFFEAMGVQRPWLFGHSDGASIALLHAAAFPQSVSGVVAVAPHILVEQLTVDSIAQAREAFLATDLRAKLGRYHADADSAFWGWNQIWLDPAFREWNIEGELDKIACPVLAVQGEEDEYGTLEQIRGIKRRLPRAELLVLPRCGHSPHRDQPQALIEKAGGFMQQPAR
ncbi:Pimeloyl-ACP methyl ester carboxylesterase [Noviherbaspirillum humi]|uniref:Pimeloyl-ACP methyl ester carboxylesterase n=1 Tax=Noviherbaspirillum humi TaxID=1688639 RepID=A0A239K2E2_9BURK|nr:alpha/beta hydrolase [Noviherbaspirillum humi]SNT12191.1 Pimeloyl-ACP methyl ester carboxylesterase [Noviherbaspirillum humi]